MLSRTNIHAGYKGFFSIGGRRVCERGTIVSNIAHDDEECLINYGKFYKASLKTQTARVKQQCSLGQYIIQS